MKLNKKTHIVIISHFTLKDDEKGEQFPANIRNFLLKRIGKVVYIDHPFIKSQDTASDFLASQMRVYEKGIKNYQLTSPKLKLPSLILFVYQAFLTIFFITFKPTKYDLCIACDNLSLLSVFIFRKVGLMKKLIYYTVDYTPKRYSNYFLNLLYQKVDGLACKISDVNWVAVDNIIAAKVENGLSLKKCSPFQVVPVGFSRENVYIKPLNKISRFNLIFVGYLFEKQGLQLAIKALPKLVRKFPKIRLIIIGSGPIEADLKKTVKLLKISPYVAFTGYINNHQKIVDLLTNSGGVGLATYIPSIGDYTYNADPSKIKLYLLCGLPVITTNVPPIAKEILRKKAGLVIKYKEQDLANSINYVLKDDKTYAKFRENALKMAKAYDINIILNKAFRRLRE